MLKKVGIGVGLLLVCVFLVFLLSRNQSKVKFTKKKKLDFTESYKSDDYRPYGTSAFAVLLPTFFKDAEVEIISGSLYGHFSDEEESDVTTYITFGNTNQISEVLAAELIPRIKEGDNLFLAHKSFSAKNLDSIIGMDNKLRLAYSSEAKKAFAPLDTNLVFNMDEHLQYSEYFKDYDGEVMVLADFKLVNTPLIENAVISSYKPICIKKKLGKGNVYLLANPLMFTNYGLMKSDTNYTFIRTLFAQIPSTKVVWWNAGGNSNEGRDLLGYIWSQKPLRIGFLLLLSTVLVLFVLGSKRVVRLIPIIEAPKNQTLGFVRTVSSVFFRSGNHDLIYHNRIKYLQGMLLSQYSINPSSKYEEVLGQLMARSGVPQEVAQALLIPIYRPQTQYLDTEAKLYQLDNHLNNFYHYAKLYGDPRATT